MERVDSAEFYLKKASYAKSLYTRKGAFNGLYYLNRDIKKDLLQAMYYADRFYMCADSISKLEKDKEVLAIEKLYENEKLLTQNQTLQIERDRALLLIVVVVSILVFCYQRKLLQKKQTIQKQQEILRTYSEQIHVNEQQMEQNKAHIIELSEQLAANDGYQDVIQEQQQAMTELKQKNEELEARTSQLKQVMDAQLQSQQDNFKREMADYEKMAEESARLRKHREHLCSLLIAQSKPLQSLLKRPAYLDESQWTAVTDAINTIYTDFTGRLRNSVPAATDTDVQLCCLMKLRIPVKEMADIMGISPGSISKKKQRLKEVIIRALGDQYDSAQLLDVWVWEF
ncbi:MAG: hypothetical protein LBL97_01140 [Prevotellaceae bacterium]|jgi:DNA repair exonuclease SbcCD ATPase subunit|nr:hypothetical protein [Prevotellaceae bacterium]